MSDTIAALASAPGRAGVAVIRISGPEAGPALRALTKRDLPAARRAARRTFLRDAAAIDEGLALWFPAPASFTGEDVAELHCHGGPAVVGALIEALLALPGLRLAEPGEFTRRAFEHGKLDLTEAEGLADLVDAETEGQRVQALAQMRGALGRLYEGWRADLIAAMARLEAAIDFPDEDLPADLAAQVSPRLAALEAEIAVHLADAQRGERVRDGYRAALIGAPNAGKSSLLNALADRPAAIVSDIAGTTRDVVEIRLVLAGFVVIVADTAGLREAGDPIEIEGVRRARLTAEEADLRIAVVDGAGAQAGGLDALRDGDWIALNKIDLGEGPAAIEAEGAAEAGRVLMRLSLKTGEGVEAFRAALADRVRAALSAREAPALTRARHRLELEAARAALARAQTALEAGAELAAEEARRAAFSLGRLTGRVDVEDVLSEIFSSFCIGK